MRIANFKKQLGAIPQKVVLLLCLLIACFTVATPLAPVFGDPLSASEVKALNEYANWVASTCPGSSSTASSDDSTDTTSLTTVTAGQGAPDGAEFPNLDPTAMASSINAFINKENPQSKLKGLGKTIVADGKNSNVNPFLIVAIAREESNMSDPSDYNVSHGNNSFGREAAPGQPSFSGANSWYRWSSVEASVDYTAQENQGVNGGGDMGTYLKDQYGSAIAHSNLVSLFLQYAPPSENDTAAYTANVKSWISNMVQGAQNGGGNTTPTDSSGSSSGTQTFSGPDAACCPPASSGSGDTAAPLSGNSNAEQAFNFFITNGGFTTAQSAGIVGNMEQESGVNPTSSDGAGNGGIVGFTYGGLSMASMTAWVTSHGENPSSLKGQLDFILWYITKSDPSIAAAVKATNDVKSATLAWEDNFEKCRGYDGSDGGPNAPGSCMENQRIAYAQQIFEQFGGNAPDGGVNSSCGNSAGAPDCQTATGNAKILCEAEAFKGVYYEWGGGHGSLSDFQKQCPDPTNPPNNQPHGGPVNGDPSGLSGNPSPCAVDCSGLVDIATEEAFGTDMNGANVEGLETNSNWKKITDMGTVQPGDIVTVDPNVHVEIVYSYNSSSGQLTTFGAHQTGEADGTTTSTLSSWSAAYRYVGPGSG